jgi:DNA-binding MarR family transcriptional regulator
MPKKRRNVITKPLICQMIFNCLAWQKTFSHKYFNWFAVNRIIVNDQRQISPLLCLHNFQLDIHWYSTYTVYMAIDKKMIREIEVDFLRLMNKFNKLEKQPIDFGTGNLLSPTEIHTIDEIGKKKETTVTELCDIFGVTKGAVSQMVGKLAQKGYVSKVRNENFGKEILLSLTPKGYKAFKAHNNMHIAIDEDFTRELKDINLDQIAQFRENLNKIENHVDKYINLLKA